MAGTIETTRGQLGYDVNFQSADADAVTPADGSNLTNTAKGLYVGGAGTVKVTMANGGDISFVGVPAGTFLPIIVTKVFSTGTTATNIVALY